MRDLPKEARGSNPNPSPNPPPDQVRDLPEEALQSAVRRCNYCATKADNVRTLPCFISQGEAVARSRDRCA